MHKGQIYLSQMDVEAEISGVGAHVSFFIYADGTGLGAMNCRPAGGLVPVQPVVQKPQLLQARPQQVSARVAFAGNAGAARPPMPIIKQRVSSARVTGQVKNWKGGFGWITPMEPVNHPLFKGQIYVKASDILGGQPLSVGATVSFYVYADSQGLGAEECMEASADGTPPPQAGGRQVAHSAGPPKFVEPKVAPGPRERLTVVPTTGEVLEWKSTFGWIRPHEAVDHPAASKRDGKVYVAKKDLVNGSELHVGQLVQFHVFVDNTGVGAEECMPF